MNMIKEWYDIYDKNKYLDNLFQTKYKHVLDYKKRNYVGFLVELGEFVNETKCFKYWTIKKPNMELVLDEYADCITGVLTFFNDLNLNLDLEELSFENKSDDILEVINNLYKKGTELMEHIDEQLLRDLLLNLLYVGKLLDFKEEEIVSSIKKKQEVVEQRLNSDY